MQLEHNYSYYKIKFSTTIARKSIKAIIEKTIILELNPKVGTIEPLLTERQYEYRFLIEKNYKIIYRYSDHNVKIILVSDCRRNPVKLERLSDSSL